MTPTRAYRWTEAAIERKYAYLCGLVFLVACADSRPLPIPPTPTSPTPVTPAPAPCPPCPPAGVHALSGVVRAAGVPMAGATVGLVKLGPQTPLSPGPEDLIASRVTDESGSYNFPSVENVSFSGALVSVSQADYFTDTKYILMSQDRQLDFDLERAGNHISVGEVTMGQIGQARCASFGYGGGGGAECRRFALPLTASGTLEVTVSSNPARPFDMSVLQPDGTIGFNGASSLTPLTVALTVTAGLTYQIDVFHIDPSSREFELRTRLR